MAKTINLVGPSPGYPLYIQLYTAENSSGIGVLEMGFQRIMDRIEQYLRNEVSTTASVVQINLSAS